MFVSGHYVLESVTSEAFNKIIGTRGKLDACEGGLMVFRLHDGRTLESRTVCKIESIAGGSYVSIVTGSGNRYEFLRCN